MLVDDLMVLQDQTNNHKMPSDTYVIIGKTRGATTPRCRPPLLPLLLFAWRSKKAKITTCDQFLYTDRTSTFARKYQIS
jgi:hypothetical protein